jgi:hypothetical protein
MWFLTPDLHDRWGEISGASDVSFQHGAADYYVQSSIPEDHLIDWYQ